MTLTIYETRKQEWKKFNEEKEKDERKLSSRRCEECGIVGFSFERVVGLKRKIIYNIYTLGGLKNFEKWECKNKILCDKTADLYRSGQLTPDTGMWR